MPTSVTRNTIRQPGRLYCENCGGPIAPENEREATVHNPQPDGTCEHFLSCSEECLEEFITAETGLGIVDPDE